MVFAQTAEMESYRILKKIETPADHVGDTVAIYFDYGLLTHPVHGEADLKGICLCFEKFVDLEALSEANDASADKCRGAVFEWAEDLESLGVDFTRDKQLKEASKNCSYEAIEPHLAFYPDMSRNKIKLILAMHMGVVLVDEIMESPEVTGQYRHLVIDVVIAALRGEIRHLAQIPSLPEDFKACIACLISARNEALKSSVPEEWVYFQQGFIRYCQSSFMEEKGPIADLNEYLLQRTHTNGMYTSFECIWMYHELRLPEKLRHDPAFIRYFDASCLYAGIINDICGVAKEIKSGGLTLVLVLAKSMPLQEAVDTAVKILENKFFETKDAARALLQTFPQDETVRKVVSIIGRTLDIFVSFTELLKLRYGITGKSFYSVVEFNSVYEEKEKELEAVLRKGPLTPPPEQKVLLAELTKLVEDMRLNNNGIQYGEHEIAHAAKILPAAPQTKPLSVPPAKATPTTQVNGKQKKFNHIALIPDGNRRWARAQGHSPLKGHSAGVAAIKKLMNCVMEKGVHTFTVWVLSPENFERTPEELENLWDIYRHNYGEVREIADEWGARIEHIGDRTRIPADILERMIRSEEETKDRTAYRINLAIDYGGRQEIARAMSRIEGDVTLDSISKNLFTSDHPYPEPDLIIRTGAKDAGTVRTSGFLSWQSAYAEFLFEDKYLPEILPEDVDRWFEIASGSERRFGK